MSPVEGDPPPPVGDGDHVIGPRAAPLTIVEYGDFECPACGQAFGHIRRVRSRLGEELRLVFRHLPLPSHPNAQLAAEAAEAAGAQDRFWEMHDILFHHTFRLQREDLLRYAERIGLDEARFVSELDSRVHRERVEADAARARESGVHATPGVFVEGKLLPPGVYESEVLLRELGRA